MIIPFSQLKPGDKFRWIGKTFVKVYGCGQANCAEMCDNPRDNTFAVIPWDAMVECAPYDSDLNYSDPSQDEIERDKEYRAKGQSMIDRIASGEFDNPLDKETDQWTRKK
jgi:hypothetical protein